LHNKQLLAIVDDDDSVRVATSRLVRSLGWEVILFDTATAFLNSGCAAEVMKNGALSFLNKPVDGAALQACLDRIGKAAPSA